MTLVLDKIPPQAVEMEEAVLGAMMISREAVPIALGVLKGRDRFYQVRHQLIFEAIASLDKRGQPVDILTVSEQLKRDGVLEEAGGTTYVSELSSRISSSAHTERHAKVIYEKWLNREMIRLSTKLVRESYEDSSDPFELMDRLNRELLQLRGGNEGSLGRPAWAIVKDNMQVIEEMRAGGITLPGLPTGLPELDQMIHGLEKGMLYLIGARPGMGKSTFLQLLVKVNAIDRKLPVHVESLEMKDTQITLRMLSDLSRIPFDKLKKANYEGEFDNERLFKAGGDISDTQLWISDKGGRNIQELRSVAMIRKQTSDIQLLIVDYLQLMRGVDRRNNREQEISEISSGLKLLAKDLDIPVVGLTQLSRAVETRGGDKRPQLSDLRESGTLEQDADAVIFLYRPEYYGINEYGDGTPTRGLIEHIVAKNRHGRLGTVTGKFEGPFYRIGPKEDKMI